ncbi:Cation/H+ exchanger [Gymnopilus junonius]|uniref:Cation/H+ exchanger n=1 Tax=Gymnopilus junonius TaxID=109634 RepID=A0A9P5TRI4_GYMJU|nr:Cation/H+ exchanger [Gymnopilus junonius]
MVALTGIMLPLALSMATFKGAWGYGGLQAFAAGAALCSTSLGTTIALLTPELRKTRVGSVLMAAALLDDVVGLVIAGIISGLAGADSGVKGEEVVRPLLVSFAFGFGTPMLALVLKKLRVKWPKKQRSNAPASSNYMLHSSRVQLFIVVLILSAFVAGSRYAGTSDLFGAYLAGAFLSYLFDEPHPEDANSALVLSTPTLRAFDVYLQPILVPLLEPIFFSSIGTSIPVKSLVTTYPSSTTNYDGKRLPSHRVVWRGMVYALLMVLGKMAVGLWFLVWPGSGSISRFFRRHLRGCADAVKTLILTVSSPTKELTHSRGALLLGIAMVARGEIALIVAQLARPLLLRSNPPSKGSLGRLLVLVASLSASLPDWISP